MIKYWKQFLVGLILVLGIAACQNIFPTADTNKEIPQPIAVKTPKKLENLAEVAPLVTPKLPNWIAQISPKGEAKPLNQIRIKFKNPVIPLENLDSPGTQAKLKYFEIEPKIPGQFRFLTPSLVGFQPEQAIPKATRVQVTIKSGLSDEKNNTLAEDFAWTFNTEPIKLTNLPASVRPNEEPQVFDVKPTLKFTANVELDLASVENRIELTAKGTTDKIPVTVELDQEANQKYFSEAEVFDPSQRQWYYQIIPQQELTKSATYQLDFTTGIRPVSGNLRSETPFASEFKTYDAFAFKGLQFYGKPDAGGAYNRFTQGAAQLKFNNALKLDSALANIKISPAPKEEIKVIQSYEGSQYVSLNPWALEPNTEYTITVNADLQDKFGQSLENPVEVKYNTGDLAGNIDVPGGLNIFPPNQDLQLNIKSVNLPESQYQATYQVVQPTDLVYTNYAYPDSQNETLLSSQAKWQNYPVKGNKNETIASNIPIVDRLGLPTGMLAYGVKANTNKYIENGQEKWREYNNYGLVQLTNIGVFSQWFPDSGIIKTNHLSDGAPVAANIEIYKSQLGAKSRPQPTPCATGKTDNSGVWLLDRTNFRKCLPEGERRFTKAPELLIIAKADQDWAFTRIEEYSGAYGYDVNPVWPEGKPENRGVIFSDRTLYQPGEKIALTGVAAFLNNGEIQLDKNTEYTLTLENPTQEITELGTVKTNNFGTFSQTFNLGKNQPLGNYLVKAKTGNLEITGGFRIAEFKPPNFKVDLNLDKQIGVIGDRITANATSKYLFGAPVQGGKIKYYITRSQTNFIPKGWEKFSFGRDWFWPEERPQVSSDVSQENNTLDAEGKSNQSVTIKDDLPYPMTYRIDTEVSDVSNLSVTDSKTFTALPDKELIGLQTDWVANANQPFKVQVIVTNYEGKPTDEKVKIELQKMDYSSVTQVREGSETARHQIEYKTVDQKEINTDDQPETISLTAKESGSYRIRANFASARNELTATDVQIWVTGDDAVNWGEENGSNQLEIKLDKDTYQPGETATALIQSPYPEAELYFAVIRDRVLYQETTKVKGGAPQIQFKVTPEMLPNAAVQAVLIRQGKAIDQADQSENLEHLAKIGLVPFNVDLGDKYLKVQVIPEKSELAPQGEETINLKLQDNNDQPVKGEVTVMVVNEAVLQLTGYRPPNLVEIVYSPQAIPTRFSDNRQDVKVSTQVSNLKEKGWGFGGGLSDGLGSTRIRKEFQPLAAYQTVMTNNKGEGKFSFTLPDDLTTWRVMAVANDGNLRFGNGDNTFITTQPLMVSPIIPQFARVGDRLSLGLSVTNNTKDKGELEIKGNASGSLIFAEKDQKNHQLKTRIDKGTKGFRFPTVATKAGEAEIEFTTKLNNRERDGFQIKFPVKQLTVSESVVDSGISDKNVTIPVNLSQNVLPEVGGLQIALASTLIPEITAPAKQVLEKDSLPFLESSASQLKIASNLRLLSQKYRQSFTEFNPKKTADQAIEQLEKLQKPDGGFAYHPNGIQSDPFVTPDAAEAIALANQAFPGAVKPATLNNLKSYLRQIIANPGKYDFCQDQLCKNQLRLSSLMALAELGEKSNQFLADIYADRDQYDPITQIKLTRYLGEFSEWRKQSKELAATWQENINETGRNATVNLPRNWSWLGSPTATQAQALRLFIAQKANPETIDKLLQSLLNLRRQGTWPTTYDNAEALTALVAYSQTQPTPPNFTATIKLAGKELDSVKFVGYDNPNWFTSLAMNQLPKQPSDLVLTKSGRGNLHYLVEYAYRLPGDQPGRFNGLRVAREIYPANGGNLVKRIDLSKLDQPLQLQPGQVFDIGLEVIADRAIDHVVITDQLPAGLEAVDTSFKTANTAMQAASDSWQIDYQTIYKDRIVAYADQLDAGVYSLHYLVRSVTPGSYHWPGAEAKLEYAPEEFGRSASTTLEIKE